MYELDFAAQTDQGLVRETNQDVARVIPRLGLALVADGMGGHDHGHIASAAAAGTLEQSFERLGGQGAHIDETAERLQAAFHDANQRIADHPKTDEGATSMGTTLVAAVFAHGRAVIANVGDSRCYRLRSGVLERLTEDHSFAAQLRRPGKASPLPDAEPDDWAHVLTRCINGDPELTVDMRIVRCEPGDVYLLCSDGLWGAADDRQIAAALDAAGDSQEACERLVGAAWAGGGLDNIGIAVVRLVPLQVRLGDPFHLEQRDRASDLPAGDA